MSLAVLIGLPVLTIPLISAPNALAHDQVIETTPGAGETISANPVELSILTSGELLDLGGNSAGFAITVTDDSGLFYGDGCVSVDGPSLSTSASLGDTGPYTVTYQYVSGDGHTLSGQYAFDFVRPDDYLPAAGQSQPPVCGEPPVYPPESTTGTSDDNPPEIATPTQQTPAPTQEDAALPSTTTWVVPLAIAGIAVTLIGTMSYLFITRQRARRTDSEQ